MRHRLSRILAMVLLALTLGGAHAAGALVVITNPSVSLSAGEVGDVFLGEKQFSGSTKLVPVDNAAAQDAFLAKVLHLEVTKYKTSWTKKAFRDGANPPPVKATDAEVIEFVKRTPGGVGYVTGVPADGVKVIELK